MTTALRTLIALSRRLEQGAMIFELPDGRRHVCRGRLPGPEATIIVRDARFASAILRGGTVGLGEAYMEGWYDSPDIAKVVEVGVLNRPAFHRAIEGNPVARTARTLWLMLTRQNTRQGSRRNIAYHYDLGNEFYAQWLDPSMTYSSAVYPHESTPLEQAQREKYLRILKAGGIGESHKVLEIGCGWGGFAEAAAREVGCRVTAITVSRAQYEFAAARIQRQGLSEKVELRLQDYRDIEAGAFDRIASIEMFEAVGERFWPLFFGKMRDALKPGGIAAMQVITLADDLFDSYKAGADFVQRYIFPGGMLPTRGHLVAQAGAAGFTATDDAGYGLHYARTLKEWNDRFQAAWPKLRPLGFDDRFKRMWEFYLAYCAGGFTAGCIDVRQFALVKA